MTAEHACEPLRQAPSLTITVVHDAERRTQRIAVMGEIDVLTVDQLQEAVTEVLRRHQPRRVEISLRGVSFLDSTGIRGLLSCHADAASLGCHLMLTDPHPMASQVLHITGLTDFFGLPEESPVT